MSGIVYSCMPDPEDTDEWSRLAGMVLDHTFFGSHHCSPGCVRPVQQFVSIRCCGSRSKDCRWHYTMWAWHIFLMSASAFMFVLGCLRTVIWPDHARQAALLWSFVFLLSSIVVAGISPWASKLAAKSVQSGDTALATPIHTYS